MQKPSLRQLKNVSPPQPSPDIVHFTLEGLLPASHILALNVPLGTLSLLVSSPEGPRLLDEEQFTDSEICVLRPLMESYPHFCPYELLLAHFTNKNVTEAIVERCHQRLQRAQEMGTWDQEMRPVRNVLSRTRLKLHTFEVDILSILETGYILMYRSRYRRH